MVDHKNSKYKRILLKLSGEALMGEMDFGIDPKVLDRMALEIGQLKGIGVQVGLVIGGGNLFRGKALSEAGLDRVAGDHMGMLATVMNALAMRDALERANITTRVMSAIPMSGVVDHYDRRSAIRALSQGDVVIFAAGTGNPFFTTDRRSYFSAFGSFFGSAVYTPSTLVAFSTRSASISIPRRQAAESVVKKGLPVPAAKITTSP